MMMKTFTYPDMTSAWNDLMQRGLWEPDSLVDFKIKGRGVVISDLLISCDSSALELDLCSIGCTMSRWKKFLKTYFPEGTVVQWLEKCKDQPPGSENFLPAKSIHTWGGCFLGVSYRRIPEPRLVLYSRVCLLPLPGTLELVLVSLLGQRLGNPPLTWFAANVQWEDMKQLSYLIFRDQLDEFIRSGTFLARQVGVNYRGALTHHHTRAGRIRTVQAALRVKELPTLPVSILKL